MLPLCSSILLRGALLTQHCILYTLNEYISFFFFSHMKYYMIRAFIRRKTFFIFFFYTRLLCIMNNSIVRISHQSLRAGTYIIYSTRVTSPPPRCTVDERWRRSELRRLCRREIKRRYSDSTVRGSKTNVTLVVCRYLLIPFRTYCCFRGISNTVVTIVRDTRHSWPRRGWGKQIYF